MPSCQDTGTAIAASWENKPKQETKHLEEKTQRQQTQNNLYLNGPSMCLFDASNVPTGCFQTWESRPWSSVELMCWQMEETRSLAWHRQIDANNIK